MVRGVRAGTCVAVAVLVGAGCGSSDRSVSGGDSRGRIVVQFNGGLASDSYVAFEASGQRHSSLGIPGHEFAGFTRDLATAAVADQGTIGSGHPQTTIRVGGTAPSHKSTIWTLNDDLTTLPAWNPSGSLLAFGLTAIQSRDGGSVPDALQDGLWIVSPNGQHPHLLAPGEIGAVAWSPDGSRLAFVSGDGLYETLKVISVAGGQTTELGSIQTGIGVQPIAWSPDGREVLVAYTVLPPGGTTWSRSGVDEYPVSGGSPHPVFPGQSIVEYTGVAYSPNGSEIAVSTWAKPPGSQPGSATTIGRSSKTSGSGYQVEVVRADGSLLGSFPLDSDGKVTGWYTD